MPTNQEWLHKLANESPDELKAWFDAEHNDDLAAEKVVSGDAAHSNDGNAHLKAHSKTEPLLTEQSESLTEQSESLSDEVDRLQRRNDELRTSYDKLKRERDNLADDLLTCNREREHLRKNLGIALDHAHDICALVDIGA